MTPYKFYCITANYTKEKIAQRYALRNISLAKRVLEHLNKIGWTDDDIIIIIPKMVNTLISRYEVPSFRYICGILLKTNVRPLNTSTSVAIEDNAMEKWALAEIERLSKELSNAN